jgi:hypothetical protein
MATSLGYKLNKHPIAQSFFVDKISGIYVTKVDLFFSQKDADFPVTLQLRPMDNGYPSATEIIPGSQVVTAGSGVNTSADATAATTFTFPEPVYLKGLTDYAIVLTADSIDYEVYIAQTNEFLVGSTEKRVDRQPTSGSLFYSQNNVTFTAAQNQDLTFKIHKARFLHSTGTAVLNNADVPKYLLTENALTFTQGSSTVRVKHVNCGLHVGEDITIAGVDSGGFAGIDESYLNGTHTVTAVDWTGYSFTAGATATATADAGNNAITATTNIPYTLIYPHVQTLIPNNTSISAGLKGTTGKSFAGTETAFQKSSSFANVQLNSNNLAAVPYVVANAGSEASELGSNQKSLDLSLNMSSSDSNVSPMIDMQRVSATLVNNLVDRPASAATSGFNSQFNFVDETSATGGSSAAKHVSSPVTLQQDAVGLKIILTANRPSTTDFQVYYRTATDDQNLYEQDYSLLSEETNNPTDESPRMFREYRYLAGGLGGDLPAFTQFQTKIVLRSTNAAKVPVIKDLRVIAMSV